jgi:crotonobetainyl-CoA:carnitine CoA-transferase CaiB-like acyl-CoA transferase
MHEVLKGIRVLEVASWGFVPSCGAALADWGAEVIKVEPAATGDPMRGLMTSGVMPESMRNSNFMFEFPNRGKRSIGIDIDTPDGHALLMKLVEKSDVFLTSYLPPVRRKLKVDIDDVRAVNPTIIYARGSGYGPQGPDNELPGYDAVSFWARGGIGAALSPAEMERPLEQRTPAFGDSIGGLNLAGGIAAAIAGRELGQPPATVDVSLMSTATWILQPLVAASALFGLDKLPSGPRHSQPNVLVGSYRTQDGRTIQLVFLQPDRYWSAFCDLVGWSELKDDPRFATMDARSQNNRELGDKLDALFASKPLAAWKELFKDLDAPWGIFQTLSELREDPQAVANGYVKTTNDGVLTLVPAPMQFDETAPELRRAPEFGADTELILMDLGLEWDEIEKLKNAKVIN